jgi:hypothetical protein
MIDLLLLLVWVLGGSARLGSVKGSRFSMFPGKLHSSIIVHHDSRLPTRERNEAKSIPQRVVATAEIEGRVCPSVCFYPC